MSETVHRVVVVTGASRGVGLEWVRQLNKKAGTLIVAIVRDPNKASSLQPLLSSSVVAVQGDLSDIESFSALTSRISKVTDGKVDVLINNAGIMTGAGADSNLGISKSTVGEWQEQFHVNVTNPVFLTTSLLPLLRNGREKKVVNIASFFGDTEWSLAHPELQNASYSVTKAAITMATIKFHNELREEGFTFLALNPGWVTTDMGGSYAALTPESSISQCLSFVNRSTTKDSGGYYSLDGRKEGVTN
ncbi:hypothetical protein M409DRAFT_22569 [Zasmidium cellare ATCC 36951]|uniref:NAD(P)-binding protein n=1 Tax=Zasmidium cellare ATCC 36951 TaxID=1080233 RepID=A0A6A6CLQ3_ZASCE|nr:uncharacterized protein M409DRAFT_22569 [Zasmidium cellare ATCC 36951]KAF2167138.1 hypothetical protein M409DRAFT_22569 [Zasmidium cellare ATCC 36951]